MRLYIAGPMRGYPQFNFPMFFEAEAAINDMGIETWNPARKDLEVGLDPTDMDGTMAELEAINFDLRKALEWDLLTILHDSDGVVLLPGWHLSSGAKTEYALARAIGLDVYLYLAHERELLPLPDEEVMLLV